MTRLGLAVACAAMTLVGATPAFASVTFDGGYSIIFAEVGVLTDSGSDSAEDGGYMPLSLGTTNVSHSITNSSNALAAITSNILFTSADAGIFSISANSSTGNSSKTFADAPAQLIYNFTTDTATNFNFSYNISRLSPVAGSVAVAGLFNSSNTVFELGLHDGATGSQSYVLGAGQYTLNLNDAAFSRLGEPLSQSVINDIFSFSMSPALASAVPEPASWALMIIGFGVAGTMLRRQRQARDTIAFA